MTEVASLNTDHITRREAERIAREIDPKAGGFFHNALTRAALLGAEAQRNKLGQGLNKTIADLQQQHADLTAKLAARVLGDQSVGVTAPCDVEPDDNGSWKSLRDKYHDIA